jgi:hypothetical protein
VRGLPDRDRSAELTKTLNLPGAAVDSVIAEGTSVRGSAAVITGGAACEDPRSERTNDETALLGPSSAA